MVSAKAWAMIGLSGVLILGNPGRALAGHPGEDETPAPGAEEQQDPTLKAWEAVHQAIIKYLEKKNEPPAVLEDLVDEGFMDDIPDLSLDQHKTAGTETKRYTKAAVTLKVEKISEYPSTVSKEMQDPKYGGVIRTFSIKKAGIKDTGGWGYIKGVFQERPFFVIFIDCKHPVGPGEGPVFQEACMAAIRLQDTLGQTEWTDMVEGADVLREKWNRMLSGPAAPKGATASLKSAIAIYYGDTEGKYPASISELAPMYLERGWLQLVQKKFLISYDPETGDVQVRGK